MTVRSRQSQEQRGQVLLERQVRGRFSRTLDRLRRNQLTIVGVIAILIIVLIAISAPILPLKDPNAISLGDRLSPIFSDGGVLGTDEVGRDMLSRLVWGARVSLIAGFLATAIAAGIGITLGLIAGYFGGWVDNVMMRVTDMIMAFPTILLALAIIAVFGTSLTNSVLAIGFAGFPYYTRIVRSSTLSIKEQDYVLSARAVGGTHRRLMARHILPNAMTPILITISLDVGNKIILTSGLSFLGLGTQPPTADWGTMLAKGRTILTSAPHVATLPGLAIFIVVLSFNLIGDGLRDVFDPRTELN